MSATLDALVSLSRTLGDPSHDLAILAEGNVSGRASEGTFWVKASGTSMRTITPQGFVEVLSEPTLDALDIPELDDDSVRATLQDSRVRRDLAAMPSVETFMHAYLLSLPGVEVVGHTHPTSLIPLLSVEGAEELAEQRLYPDEIVLCGPATVFVPYLDPGLPLARGIRDAVLRYVEARDERPKTIWLQNHGLIALGATTQEVENTTLMATKAARVWLAALSTGRPLHPLTPAQIARIHTRPDEHYRQRLLGLRE